MIYHIIWIFSRLKTWKTYPNPNAQQQEKMNPSKLLTFREFKLFKTVFPQFINHHPCLNHPVLQNRPQTIASHKYASWWKFRAQIHTRDLPEYVIKASTSAKVLEMTEANVGNNSGDSSTPENKHSNTTESPDNGRSSNAKSGGHHDCYIESKQPEREGRKTVITKKMIACSVERVMPISADK